MAALIHELFEQQVRRTPDATAVRFRRRTLTYAELNARSNRLAGELRSAGVQPTTIAAIEIPRSELLVVAVLAVLKAGGCYVYLDAADPAERRQAVIAAAGADVVLVAGAGEPRPGSAVTVSAAGEHSGHAGTNPRTALSPEQAAYVLFTSGSTGEPKGVLVSHDAVANYLGWAVEEYGIADGSGAPVHTSLGFDLTITSLFGPLTCGRTVVMLPETDVMSELAGELAADRDFSILKLTPSHLLVLNEYLDPGRLAGSVRTLIVGGEALRCEALETWRTYAPATRVVNEYGPTEATVGCCRHWVTRDERSGPVPIGTAAPTTALHILDDELRPVPDGETGELYLVGSQLAIGYLNNKELTGQRFIDLTVSPGERQRAYRTGDLAFRDERGSLMYVGRNDRQVKVRGYRVELGEIETALCREAGITAAHVIFADGIITAYVRRNGGAAGLPRRLSQTLPPYMTPQRYVDIDEVPLTANGKVDYERLAALGDAGGGAPASREQAHEILLDIWSAVLERPVDSIDANFFALDGDSILAVLMVARARELGVPISLQQVFVTPTIRQLADGAARGPAPEADASPQEILSSVAGADESPA
jgi:amino acid adenylation domain-containing protein